MLLRIIILFTTTTTITSSSSSSSSSSRSSSGAAAATTTTTTTTTTSWVLLTPPTRNTCAASLEHVQVVNVLARVGNLALRQERARFTRNHFRCSNLGTEMRLRGFKLEFCVFFFSHFEAAKTLVEHSSVSTGTFSQVVQSPSGAELAPHGEILILSTYLPSYSRGNNPKVLFYACRGMAAAEARVACKQIVPEEPRLRG